jgi:hypothetical protein
MSPRSMIFPIIVFVTVISPTAYGSLIISDPEYPPMHYTILISQEHFTAGRPLVIVLPLAKEDSTKKKLGYSIEELHIS